GRSRHRQYRFHLRQHRPPGLRRLLRQQGRPRGVFRGAAPGAGGRAGAGSPPRPPRHPHRLEQRPGDGLERRPRQRRGRTLGGGRRPARPAGGAPGAQSPPGLAGTPVRAAQQPVSRHRRPRPRPPAGADPPPCQRAMIPTFPDLPRSTAMTMTRHLSRSLFLALLLASGGALADLDSDIRQLQTRWAEVNYELNGKTQLTAFEQLTSDADQVIARHPDRAEGWIWRGIIHSTHAGAKGGLGALALAKAARADLEKALALDDLALHGSAYTSLGTLYFNVPGWPVGFGD